jgi:nucleoside-diphosphate-sugar epimerase
LIITQNLILPFENSPLSIHPPFKIAMRIAIAGAGDLAKYLVEELLAASHEVVVLSRSLKPWFERRDISFRPTDYSVPSLVVALEDCDGLISALLDYSLGSVIAHLALLEACQKSPKCKRFMPSEYGGNVDLYPESPEFYYANHEPVRQALRAQKDVMWTLFNMGWLSDYFVSAGSRYIKDIGDFHPVNFETGVMTIPGTGEESISFTAARDAAAAMARLIDQDNWEATTFVCGETTTWNSVAKLLARHGRDLKVRYVSLDSLQDCIKHGRSGDDDVIAAQYAEFSLTGGAILPQEKVERQKEQYFKGVKIRSVEEVVLAAEQSPWTIV